MKIWLNVLLCLGLKAGAAIHFPASVKIAKQDLILNGTGFRTATIFKVKVYQAALYTPKKTSEVSELLNQFPKKMDVVFLRDVDKEDVDKAWRENFPKNCEKNCEKTKAPLEKLISLLSAVKENEKMTFLIHEDRVEIFKNDSKLGEVADSDLAYNIPLSWIGKEPPNASLKEGLLGLVP